MMIPRLKGKLATAGRLDPADCAISRVALTLL